MKKNQLAERKDNKKLFSIIFTAIIALMLFAVSVFVVKPQQTAHAETGGTVTLHVYDPTQDYNNLAAWVWLKGGSGTEFNMTTTPADGEPFMKEYEQNGKTEQNISRRIEITFSASEMAELKGGRNMGFLICVATGKSGDDFWTRYEKETSDVFVNMSTAFDENNHADVYYVRKDTGAHTDLEEAIQTLEKITSARFTAKTATKVSIQFEVTTPLNPGITAYLSNGRSLLDTTEVTIDDDNACVGYATFENKFDFSVDYEIMIDGITTECLVSKTAFIDDLDFINIYESVDTQNQKLGCEYSAASSTFRVWAPFASSVVLRLFGDGSNGPQEKAQFMKKHIPASGEWGGVWALTIEGDLKGKYYTYVVNNNGFETETIDPYAKACGANGARAMIIDLDDTDPADWEADKNWWKKSQESMTAVDTPIIWEVTVHDFSSSADSGMKYKGKYLAFTEENTTVPGKPGLKTGVNYLKDLGITYVHLNPAYDFASVDEADLTSADGSSYNWGYDPQNYNIPEGSYSTDPYNGAVRINEFKRMVQALHNAGIGVIMDVVYNHTFNTGGQAFHDTVPYYYHRTEENGQFSNDSGCGNGTASERTMMRKFMVESLVYWAEEYHIDGFRFDLMGIHDVVTLNMIRAELDKIQYDPQDPTNNGKRILMYGEPWDGYYNKTPYSYTKRVATTQSFTSAQGKYVGNAGNKPMRLVYQDGFGSTTSFDMLSPRIAVFNDSGREGLRGNVWAGNIGSGWVNGAPGDYQRVRKMIEGGIAGSDVGAQGLHVGLASRNVAYSCAHDNYTLWDQIRGKKYGDETALYYDDPVASDVKRCKLAASTYLMSAGISFLLAGEEMGRTKYGNENSYDSPAKLNQINWSRQEAFKDLHDYYKNLIHLRRQYSDKLFSYKKLTTLEFGYGSGFEVINGDQGHFKFTRTKNGTTLTMDLNPSSLTGYVQIGTTKYNI
ncbi:MAG: hypothetical protein K2J01_00015 [Clostridiales bacterium]|nr:hypothetical protein [Clostridiales bacterium]